MAAWKEVDGNITDLDVDLTGCFSDKGWICPVTNCDAVLSRKQTLQNHLQAIHSIEAECSRKCYKLHDIDPRVPVPKSTRYYRKRHLRDSNTEGSSFPSDECSPPVLNCQSSYEENCETMTTNIHNYEETDMDLCAFYSSDDQETEILELEEDIETKKSDDEQDVGQDVMSVEKSDIVFNSKASPPLYVFAPSQEVQYSNMSYQSHLLSLCAVALKHNMSSVGFSDIARLIKIHVPEQSICETDIARIKKACSNMDDEILVHEYCLQCFKIFERDQAIIECKTPGCTGKRSSSKSLDRKNIFISTVLETQIKSIIERDRNYEKITAMKRWNSANIVDIGSGSLYKKMKEAGGFLFPADNNNITLTFFTDGVPLFKSSKVSLWPLYLIINELPPAERFLKKNMIIWGIWQGSSKLRMNTFLYPFVQDLKTLYEKGFTFSDGVRNMTGKAVVLVATMDLQARAPVLNMMHHNGECGCIYCETKGVTVASGKGYARSYPYDPETFIPRTDASLEENAKVAMESNKPYVGIKGHSVLTALPEFSITDGTVIDYMHGTLLGVVKKLLDLWLQGKSYQEHFFIGHEVSSIDQMLKKIKPPYTLRRLPRKIDNTYNHWKASEYRSWLLHYSLPCLTENTSLPDVYIHHFACLVEAIHIFLRDEITEIDLQRANILLLSFYQHFEELYNASSVGLNVHNLYHLVSCVRKWGPLWAYSCFGFESFNADVLKLVHGTGNVALQILWSIRAQKELELKTKTLPDGEVKIFLKDMLKGSSRQIPKGIRAHHCNVIRPVDVKESFSEGISTQLKELVKLDEVSEKDFSACEKIVFGQLVLYSRRCTRVKKRNSYTIEIATQPDGTNIMQVHHYLLHKRSNKVVAICDLFKMVSSVVRGRAEHCQKIEKQRNYACVLVTMDTIKDIVIFMEGNQGNVYISRIPNFVERD